MGQFRFEIHLQRLDKLAQFLSVLFFDQGLLGEKAYYPSTLNRLLT